MLLLVVLLAIKIYFNPSPAGIKNLIISPFIVFLFWFFFNIYFEFLYYYYKPWFLKIRTKELKFLREIGLKFEEGIWIGKYKNFSLSISSIFKYEKGEEFISILIFIKKINFERLTLLDFKEDEVEFKSDDSISFLNVKFRYNAFTYLKKEDFVKNLDDIILKLNKNQIQAYIVNEEDLKNETLWYDLENFS